MKRETLVVEDDRTLGKLLQKQLTGMGHSATLAASWTEAEQYLSRHEPDLMILDPRLPDADGYELLPGLVSQQPVIVLTAYGSVRSAVRAIKAGAAEYLIKPVNLEQLELEVERVLEADALRRDHEVYQSQIKSLRNGVLVGHSRALREVYRLVDAVAHSDMTVLIQGESGVGKELVASEIHERSARAKRHFMTVDCCTLHENLFESELFGHERGAFTGADRQKKGLIEVAEGSTLFLDEIGEIGPATQAKLLRVIETGQFRRLGGTKDLQAHIRIVAATNRDLKEMTETGAFRADLYYRLSAFMINVPPLRERREDIPDLVRHFIKLFSKRGNVRVSSTAITQLMRYDWPGNVRELRNVIERAMIVSGNESELRVEHLPPSPCQPNKPQRFTLDLVDEPTIDEIEKSYLEILLMKYGGHRCKVAQALGTSERTTYRLIKKYGLHSASAASRN
ncbi:MAG: sigma-54-dependent transcriptional regulator [Geminicoccaceae bacterium]